MDAAQFLNTILTPLVWALNGLLVVLFLLAEHWMAVALLPLLVWIALHGPAEHRKAALGVSALTLAAALFVSQPTPLMLLVVGVIGCLAVRAEKFEPAERQWRTLTFLALTSLGSLGFAVLSAFLDSLPQDDLIALQGQSYLNLVAILALYLLPIGCLALLVQHLFIHPPLPGKGTPESLIHALRARGQD